MDEKPNRKQNIKRIALGALGVVILIVLITLFSPITMLFIALTVFVASVLGMLVLKIFGEGKIDETQEDIDYIDDVSDLDEIRRVINLPLPYAVIGLDKRILAYNKRFANLFEGELSGQFITKLIPGFDEYQQKQTLAHGEDCFDVYCTEVVNEQRQKSVFSVCLVEENERTRLLEQLKNQQTVMGMIFIDNYDSAVEALSDFHLSILTAKIDKRLGDYVEEYGGILKKYEKDRYIYITNVKSLENLKDMKFDILNEIKEVKVKDHMSLTLSIGIGISSDSLEESMKNARDALDLALGRGGDQALIKEDDKYLFYGGKSGEISHNARIRARVKAEALQTMLNNSETVLVMGHRVPDFDAMGAAMGIYVIAKHFGKNCRIVLDEPSKAIMTLYNRVKESPEYENVYVTGEEALDLMTNKTLLVVVDTYVTYLVENEAVLEQAGEVVVFDHHRKSADYIEKAVLTYHEPYASSTCELVTEVIRHIGDELQLSQLTADALLAGISVDTKNFSVKTGAVTFEAAAYLRRKGADSIRVKKLFKNDLDAVKLKARTIETAELYRDKVAISFCEEELDGANIIAGQAADELLNVFGVKCAAVVYEMNGGVHISARSLGEFNVQLLLEKIGGGGHLTMAAAALSETTAEDAVMMLKKAIDEYLEEED